MRSPSSVDLVGHEIVEVLPDRIGSRDITALVAERVVRETLTGVAARRLTQSKASTEGGGVASQRSLVPLVGAVRG